MFFDDAVGVLRLISHEGLDIVSNLQSPDSKAARLVLLPSTMQAVNSTNLQIDVNRMFWRINGIPIDVLAMRHGIDIDVLNHPDTVPANFNKEIIKLLRHSLSEEHVFQLQSVFDQWLYGHLILPVKCYFHSRGERTHYMQYYIDIRVEDGSLHLNAVMNLTHVSSVRGDRIFRLAATAVTKSIFEQGCGFVITDLSFSGEDREALEKIYRLSRKNGGLPTSDEPKLREMSKDELRAYLSVRARCLPEVESFYSSGRLYDVLAFPGSEERKPVTVSDFLSDNDLTARIERHVRALDNISSVIFAFCKAEEFREEGGRWSNLLLHFFYKNYHARAKLALLRCIIEQGHKRDDIPKLLNQQEVILKVIKERFRFVPFNSAFARFCAYIIELICDGIKAKAAKKNIIDLQYAFDAYLCAQSSFFGGVGNKGDQKLRQAFNILLRAIVENKMPGNKIVEIADAIKKYSVPTYRQSSEMQEAIVAAFLPKLAYISNFGFFMLMLLIGGGFALGGECLLIIDKHNQGGISARGIGVLALAVSSWLLGIIGAVGGFNYLVYEIIWLMNDRRFLIEAGKSQSAPGIELPESAAKKSRIKSDERTLMSNSDASVPLLKLGAQDGAGASQPTAGAFV